MAYVQMALWFQVLRAVDATPNLRLAFYAGNALAMVSYGLSVRVADKQEESVGLHVLVHVFANIANIFLYLSPLPPLTSAWFLCL